MGQTNGYRRWGRRSAGALLAGASVALLAGCDSLLEVEIPHLLTDAAVQGPSTAEVQVNSAIALFECGYSAFGTRSAGAEDALASVAGVFSGAQVYANGAVSGTCDTGDTSTAFFDQFMGARALISTDPAKLPGATGASGPGKGVYDRLTGEWSGSISTATRERLSAIAAIYMAATLAHMGEFYCEIGFDQSEPLTPLTVLTMAEDWVTNRALVHIANAGDFVMPFGITGASGTANEMARAIRARIRWARHDLTGAAQDAAAVLGTRPTFTAWVTRENGAQRRNKLFIANTFVKFSAMVGMIRVQAAWYPPSHRPNPATGLRWPDPIPFTGYLFLGIMPDGRTLEAGNVPVRWAQEVRGPAPAYNPISLLNGAVADTRVQHTYETYQGPGLAEIPRRYAAEADDIPYMTWEELRLIQAEYENFVNNNRAAAIAHVNAIRAAKSLPQVSGAYLATLTDGTNDRAEVRALILEERRREFFHEGGRYHSTKIQNTDVLWFPRGEGRQNTSSRYNMGGVVRLLFDANEYVLNPAWSAAGGNAIRGTLCDEPREVASDGFGSLGGNPGHQAPYVS
jgi:hypothetical protein